MNGNSIEGDGTGGTAVLRLRVRRCRSISGNIPVIGILKWRSSGRFTANITATSRVTP
jgi:hypothetical protein